MAMADSDTVEAAAVMGNGNHNGNGRRGWQQQ